MKAAAVAALLPVAAHAQQCKPREIIVTNLAEKFSEQLVGGGVQTPTMIVEVWVSPSGSWTILQTFANGRSCLVASGENWREIEPEPPGEDG